MAVKRNLFGINIDAVRMDEAVARVRSWIDDEPQTCRYVVTPNVDHTVLLQENESLRRSYQDAELILADGHPIVWASRLLRQPLPERVAGSELVPALFNSFGIASQGSPDTSPTGLGEAKRPPNPPRLKVFLLGAQPGVAAIAADNMKRQWPHVDTVGFYSPPYGFENDPAECDQILDRIALCRPDVLIVGLGAPKQEIWVHQHFQRIKASAALCVGATIDFLAGEQKRAPRWMQKSGVEWVHRMCSQPKRLVKRYAKDAWVFPQLVWRQMFRRPAGA